MEGKIESYSERVLLIHEHATPLHVLAIDSNWEYEDNFRRNLSKIFLMPQRHILDYDYWRSITNRITQLLQTDILPKHKEPKLKVHKEDLIRRLSIIVEDSSYFAHIAIRNSLFLSSEGPLVFDPYDEDNNQIAILPVIRQYIYKNIMKKPDIGISQDEFSIWLNTTNFLLQPVTNSFKEKFNNLFQFEIPYGLSPATESKTLKNLILNAKNYAILPLMLGVGEAGSAIIRHEWGVAILAAATTGATVVIFLSTIALSDKVYHWIKSK